MNAKHDFHNPDNLTPEQVGDGYRLMLKSEIKDRDNNREIESWLSIRKEWHAAGYRCSYSALTYRVPLATWPLPPIETFPAAMEAVTKQESSPTDNEPKAVEAPADNDTWNCLLATNSRLEKRVAELEARLKRLEWIPYCERKPTKGDADHFGNVIATEGSKAYAVTWDYDPVKSTHWRPFAPPAHIDIDRVEFEKWWKSSGFEKIMNEETAFQCWKAARAKEVKP